jgi:hypothetical protein
LQNLLLGKNEDDEHEADDDALRLCARALLLLCTVDDACKIAVGCESAFIIIVFTPPTLCEEADRVLVLIKVRFPQSFPASASHSATQRKDLFFPRVLLLCEHSNFPKSDVAKEYTCETLPAHKTPLLSSRV